MPYCGSFGCSCCTCENCWRYLRNCICDLKQETALALTYLDEYTPSDEKLSKAVNLLRRWFEQS